MARQLSLGQLTLLVGGALLLGLFLLVLIYVLHKTLKRQRIQTSARSTMPRPKDETAFMMATVQGVMAKMREQENRLTELLREAEQRAEVSTRRLESLARDMSAALMVFDREGYLTLSNPAARGLLGIDTWSRRRYTEILGPEAPLVVRIRECLAAGRGCKREIIEHRTGRGETRRLELTLSACFTPSGEVESAVCLLNNLPKALGDRS